jgi:hypothetical protein
LAHPKGLASFQDGRVKTDWADAKELVDLLRLGRFPEAYIAPVELRELRELVRHRHKLVQVRTTQKASVHAVLGKCGMIPTLGDLFGPGGTKLLDSLRLPEPYASRVASQRRLLLMLDNDRPGRPQHPPPAQGRPQVPGVAQAQGDRAHVRRGVHRRDRGCDPVRFTAPAGLLGGADPAAVLLRHQGPAGAHLQAGLAAVAVGRDRGVSTVLRAVCG